MTLAKAFDTYLNLQQNNYKFLLNLTTKIFTANKEYTIGRRVFIRLHPKIDLKRSSVIKFLFYLLMSHLKQNYCNRPVSKQPLEN